MAINYLSDINLNKNTLENAVVHPASVPPSSPVEGQIYYNNTAGDKKLYIYNGTSFNAVDGTSVATDTTLGSLKVYTGTGATANTITTTASRTYGVQLDSNNKAVVNVPHAIYGTASANTLGLIKLFNNTDQDVAANTVTTATGRTYGIQLNSDNQAVVNVPWTAYSHPSHTAESTDINTGALTGADVISSLLIDVVTDTLGHVTSANAGVSTRTLTLANLGYTGASNANYITDNNQLANGSGFTTSAALDALDDAIEEALDGKASLSGATFTGGVSGTDLTLSGNLTVNGTTTNINSTNLVVEDKNIVLGDVAIPSDATADNGGITLKGSTDKTFNWVSGTGAWTSSERLNLVASKDYRINNAIVLNATTLGSNVVNSSLTSVGTIGTGAWNGTTIAGQYGGTGVANTGKTITLGGNLTTSGLHATTLTTTGATTVTLPTTGILATRAGAETLTNKTLTTPIISSISNTGTLTLPTSTGTLATEAYVSAKNKSFNLKTTTSGVTVTSEGKIFTIAHSMGSSLLYAVQVIRTGPTGSGETVFTDVTRTLTTITITFKVAPTDGDYTALITKMN
jgi:trimeric autotransporter adhesin